MKMIKEWVNAFVFVVSLIIALAHPGTIFGFFAMVVMAVTYMYNFISNEHWRGK